MVGAEESGATPKRLLYGVTTTPKMQLLGTRLHLDSRPIAGGWPERTSPSQVVLSRRVSAEVAPQRHSPRELACSDGPCTHRHPRGPHRRGEARDGRGRPRGSQ